jgi:hypothetical protein
MEKGEEEKNPVSRCKSLRSDDHYLNFVQPHFFCFILQFRQIRDSPR